MTETFYLETNSTDPAYNLAFEEYVMKNRLNGNILILWQNKNAVIVGRNQNTLAEINRQFVDTHHIRVIRRNTGGGAVYHDMGNLNYSFITDDREQSSDAFTGPVVQALRSLGLDSEATGRNDILVSGKKVSGTAQYRSNGRILHHGTLLFDSDPEMIAGSLNPDPTKFQSKAVQSVRSRVGNIKAHLPQEMDMPAFWNYLKSALTGDGFVPISLNEEDLRQIEKLKVDKYDTWQWNYGTGPKFGTMLRQRFPAGLLQIDLHVVHGIMESVQIFGDFLAVSPTDPLIEALTGCAYRREDIAKALDSVNIADCLGGITKEEFLQTILNT